MTKRFICTFFVLIFIIMLSAFAFADEDFSEMFRSELEYYRPIRDIPTAYETKGWEAYNKLGSALLNMDPDNLTEKDTAKLTKIKAAREKLVQIQSPEDCIWYIWDEEMPIAEDENTLVFNHATFDDASFKPFLLPYLAEDQENVKGNIIIIAGGGYSSRANDGEGYPVAERFCKLGYNCFVLQRRVAPYGKEDIFMDLQRSLRYLRYHAEELGLGGVDRMEAIGFSGGSGTIIGTVAHCYGNIQPTIYDSDYIPDEIDEMNSDFDAVCTMYGPNSEFSENYIGFVSENENLPEFFIAAGQLDYANAGKDSLVLAQSIFDRTKVELHLFADTRHGFSLGIGNNNSSTWVAMADGFFDRIGK